MRPKLLTFFIFLLAAPLLRAKHDEASASVIAVISMNMHSRKSEFISTAPDEKDQSRVYGRSPHWTSASTPEKKSTRPILKRNGSESRHSIGNRTSDTTSGRSENVTASIQPMGDAADEITPQKLTAYWKTRSNALHSLASSPPNITNDVILIAQTTAIPNTNEKNMRQ